MCEFPLDSSFTDYLLYLERSVRGILEAKAEGTTLGIVSEQTEKYLTGIPGGLPKMQESPPFSYEKHNILSAGALNLLYATVVRICL